MILSRTRPSLYIPFLMLLWGAVAALMSLVKTPAQLLGMRFLLGIMEAGFSPAILFIISTWYRRHEQSKRFMVFLSAGILSGAFGGIIAGAITDSLDGVHGIRGWRWCVLRHLCILGTKTFPGFLSSKALLPSVPPSLPRSSSSTTQQPRNASVHASANLLSHACKQTALHLQVLTARLPQSLTGMHFCTPSPTGGSGSSARDT